MNARARPVCILFNAWVAPCGRRRETLSERAVEGAAREAAECLAAEGYPVRLVPVGRRIEPALDRLRRLRPAVVVNLCEGFRGRSDGEAPVAGLLELLGLPFTGSGSAALFRCHDKFQAHAVLRAHGVPGPRAWLIEDPGRLPDGLRFPAIVKPSREDASLGIYPESVVRTAAALRAQAARVRADYGQPALVEDYIAGRELYVALVELPEPRLLPLSEIEFRGFPRGAPRIMSYDAKWRPHHPAYRRTQPVCPARVAPALADHLERLARTAFRVLGVRGYARADFRVDARGRPYVLEVNPNPDTSRDAGLMRMLAAAGLSPGAFWRGQIERALAAR